MDNPETQATLGTQDTGRIQPKHKSTTQHRKSSRWATPTTSEHRWSWMVLI